MGNILEKTTDIVIVIVAIILFILNTFTPFKSNQKLLADYNGTMQTALIKELQSSSNVSPSPSPSPEGN